MNFSSYAELAVRLANTAVRDPGEPDPLASAVGCANALGDCVGGPVTRRDLDVLRHVRAEFGAIFTAAATGQHEAAMARLNALLLQFPIQPEMHSHDGQDWHVHLAAQGSVADRVAASAVFGLALTVGYVGVSRLGVCAIASCARALIDTGHGRSRRYCAEHATPRANVRTLLRETGAAGSSGVTGSLGAATEQAAPAAS